MCFLPAPLRWCGLLNAYSEKPNSHSGNRSEKPNS
jgi:hypothetical protein